MSLQELRAKYKNKIRSLDELKRFLNKPLVEVLLRATIDELKSLFGGDGTVETDGTTIVGDGSHLSPLIANIPFKAMKVRTLVYHANQTLDFLTEYDPNGNFGEGASNSINSSIGVIGWSLADVQFANPAKFTIMHTVLYAPANVHVTLFQDTGSTPQKLIFNVLDNTGSLVAAEVAIRVVVFMLNQ